MAQQLAPFRIYDVLYATHHTPGYACRGRETLFDRLARTLARHDVHHAAVVGPRGAGKTTLIGGFAAAILEQRYKGRRAVPVLQLDTNDVIQRLAHSVTPAALITHLEQAITTLPPCLFIIDEAQKLLAALPEAASVGRILSALTTSASVQTLLLFEEESWPATQELAGSWFKSFEVISIDELPEDTCRAIINDRARYIAGRHGVRLPATLPDLVFTRAQQVSSQTEPARSLQLLDEVCAAVALEEKKVVTPDDLSRIVASRTGQSAIALTGTDQQRLRNLRPVLQRAVVGQSHVVDMVASVIERGWLGLKNTQRPLGSFLFLGPSGVGKTELARVIAREVYGTPNAFVRIDMSEYAEAHTVQRLTGAPPGYVGYEAGGQLTSAVLKQPFSLILLDEIEKADPTVFDIFLQILEDGRLTDGQGVTVDFRKTIIIATSNVGVEKIINGWLRNEEVTTPEWRQKNLLPKLTERWRLEFLNRWEGMAVFSPLSEEALSAIAQLELQKIAERVQQHHVNIQLPPELLKAKIRELADPRFGARPLKRWLEGAVETELAQHLLAQ